VGREYAEREAERLVMRERKINEVIERRYPHLKPTAQFLAGPRPESSFYTRQQLPTPDPSLEARDLEVRPICSCLKKSALVGE
jgi:hypothetical protein